jgi:hypothetical protein
MKKVMLFSLSFFFIKVFCIAQAYKGQVDSVQLPMIGSSHYVPEYTLDVTTDPDAWTKEKPGMHAAFGSEDELYFRTEVPPIKNENASWEAAGWKGERLNTQIVIWSTDTLQQVRFKLGDLRNEKGKLLSKENIQLNKVCYVLANYPYGSPEAICGGTPYKNSFLMPDRFEAFDRFDVPGKTVRAVWLSLNIPPNAEPGMYNGTFEIIAKNVPYCFECKNQCSKSNFTKTT